MTAMRRWRAQLDDALSAAGPGRRRGGSDGPDSDDAPPPRLRELDLVALGVHPPLPSPAVERDLDHRVESAVGGDDPVVIVAGPRLAGATLTLARAARLLLGDHRVVRPDPAALAGSAPLSGPADPALLDASEGVVLWLDGVGPALLAALLAARPPAGVRILATVDAALLHPDVTTVAPESGVTLLRLDAALTPTETARSRGVPVGERAVDLGPARTLLLAGPGRSPGRRPAARAATLRAAVDWARLGVPHALPTPMLARLALAYARDLAPTDTPTVAELADAIEELVAEGPRQVGRRGPRTEPLLRRLRLPEGVHHVPAAVLTAAADRLGGDGWVPPERLHQVVGDLLDVVRARAERRAVGVLALARGFDDLAVTVLRPPPVPEAPGSLLPGELYRLGVAALQAGRAAEARRWFSALLDATPDDGSWRELRARAAFWLGLDRDADPAQRREHLELVVRDGPARDASDAGLLLAELERDAGRFDAQRGCLRAAAASAREAGDDGRQAEAVLDLAHLDRHSGRVDEALEGYRRVRELVAADAPGAVAAAQAEREIEAEAAKRTDAQTGAGREPGADLVPDPVPEQRGPVDRPTAPPRASSTR